jgi:hypothetical protein
MSTTATGNYVLDNSTLANFQSWSSAIYNAFIAFGWLHTSDTGQAANPVAAVPSSTYAYWIFKANDAAAATMPIYVKVEVGYSSTSPRIRMTVGTSSNGAGTITGQIISSAPWQITQNNNLSVSILEQNNGSTAYSCFFSGSAGEFRMYMWQTTLTTSGVLFVIERSKDSSGLDTNEYVTILGSGNVNNISYGFFHAQQTITAAGLGNYDSGILCVALTSTSSTGAAFGTVAAFPVYPVLGKVGNPMLGLMAVCQADISDGAVVTVNNMYGGTHTCITVRGYGGSNGFGAAFGHRLLGGVDMAGLMRYE